VACALLSLVSVKVLVIDIGGTHVKLLATDAAEPRRFESGKHLTPDAMVARVIDITAEWHYDVIALGYPGTVGRNGPLAEPGNLACGWLGFDFETAFSRPIRIVNDAVLQALGGYDGGRMLFLGLGTGVGSAFVSERVVVPLELGRLPYGRENVGDRLGRRGRKRYGHTAWLEAVHRVTQACRLAFMADYVVLGGGNAKHVDPLPEGAQRGGNDDAFRGGFRLWEERVEPHDQEPSRAWRVVR
jgi:polyphosphate glucokinase